MEDDKIVQLYLDRDESAIKLSSEKYGSRLRSLSFGITADIQTSEECENDTYLKAWNLIPPNEPRTYLYAFLARIIRHISIDYCRSRDSLKRKAYIVELTDELTSCLPAVNNTEKYMDAQILAETINRFLATIPDEKQAIFLRRYYYLDSIAVISNRYNMSENKVKISLFRIRKNLKDFLTQEGYTL